MKKFNVYFKTTPTFLTNELITNVDLSEFNRVAEVGTTTHEKVFEVLQSVHWAWFESGNGSGMVENATCYPIEKDRSMSVGDVVENIETGEAFLCTMDGWVPVKLIGCPADPRPERAL